MKIVIKIEGVAGDFTSVYVGRYIKDFDPKGGNAYTQELGLGFLTTTQEPQEAKQFENLKDALDFWSQQSSTVPFRPDGKPNKPLTAFHVSFVNH